MVKAIHVWEPISKTPMGRPKIRWEDDVKKDIQGDQRYVGRMMLKKNIEGGQSYAGRMMLKKIYRETKVMLGG